MVSLQGRLLIAQPELRDPHFARTVVLIIQHSPDGALGLVLNRPTQTPLSEVWPQVSGSVCPGDDLLFGGGPCEGPLMVLHADPDHAQIEVLDGLFFSAEVETAQWLLDHASQPRRFFVGCSGWAPGQLEGELGEGSWSTLEAQPRHAFDDESAGQWARVAHEVADQRLFGGLAPALREADPSSN
jgi:putative transcriptional regulator